jgi:hypothetical protein
MATTSTIKKVELKPLAKIPKLLSMHTSLTVDDKVTCAICLEEYDECVSKFVKRRVETSCGHIFHRSCLNKWCYAHTGGWTYGVISCPTCRGEIYIDDGSDKKVFAWLVGCNCCTRHQENRPSVYAYDEDVDNRVMSVSEEEALRTLTTNDYIEWRRANNRRRQDDRNFCGCSCRHEMRAIIRRIAKS